MMMISDMLSVCVSLNENRRIRRFTLCSIISAFDYNLSAAVRGVGLDSFMSCCTEKSVSRMRAVKTSSMFTTLNLCASLSYLKIRNSYFPSSSSEVGSSCCYIIDISPSSIMMLPLTIPLFLVKIVL
jgi:hypothetical protein